MTSGSTRRVVALALGVVLVTGTAEPLAAGNGPPVVAPIVEQLETEGYALVETHRSWLGRIVILAARGGVLREVVINRATGTVLSDRSFATAPDATATGGNTMGRAPGAFPSRGRDGGNGRH